jgi:TonB-linked SusC/RagA family outer membrane protein
MLKNKHLWLVVFLLFVGNELLAQTRTLTGKVTGSNNESLPGASIVTKGSNKGTTSNADGNYSLSIPNGEVTLVVSMIGYNQIEKVVGTSVSTLNFELTENTNSLNEVVVTALGISREKKTLVYATQQVKTAELTEVRDPSNVMGSLQGKIANASIQQGSGGPGSGSRIVLRGNRSLQGTNNALIVVDGVPLNNGTNDSPGSDFGGVQGSDGASSINPDDIESMNVLRGASAAALYGSQAGNGVIIITTKKGRKDRINVSVNSGVSQEAAWALPFFQNEYGQGNGGKLDATSGESWGAKMTGQSLTDYLGKSATYSPQPNNVTDFFRKGTSINNAVSISGGSEKMQTYLSYTNNNVKGIIENNDMSRHTVNLRITNQVNSRFSTDAKVTYVAQNIKGRGLTGENNAPVINAYNVARSFSTEQLRQYDFLNNIGIYEKTPFPSTLASIYQNPYWMTNRVAINEVRDRVIGFISAKYKLNSFLTLSGKANLDKTIDRGEQQFALGTILWDRAGGNYNQSQIIKNDLWLDAMIEGNNNITNDLKINYRVGAIYQDSKFDAANQSAGGLNITNKFSLGFAKAPSVSTGASQVQTQSVFGQANLSFKEYLFLDLSLRNDWDSRLPAPHAYQYPSAGASVILSQLMKLPDAITFLKANLNYAQVGNGGRFGLLNSVYRYGQGAGNGFLQISSTLPLPDLKPEIVKNIEGGVEARFLQNRIGFNLSVYKSNSFNQLLQVPLPIATGFYNQYINAGNIQNTGLELVIDGSPIDKGDLKWNMTLNIGRNVNKIIELSDQVKTFYLGGGFGRSATPVATEGQPYGDLLAFRWKTNASGQYIVDDKGLPVLTEKEESIGNFNPKMTVGFTNSFEYKNLSLRILVDGRVGGTIVSGTEMNLAFSGIPEVTALNRETGWTLGGVTEKGEANTKTVTAQDFWQRASGKRYGNGEFFAYDATSFRVRELSIGYNLPIPDNKYITGAKLSLVGRNLAWLYRGSSLLDIPGLGKRKMWFDPDMSLGNQNWQGAEYGTMPSTRTMGVNLQLTF